MRWLSTGRVLQRVQELREEIVAYLKNEDPKLAKHFQDMQWLAKFAFHFHQAQHAEHKPSREGDQHFRDGRWNSRIKNNRVMYMACRVLYQ